MVCKGVREGGVGGVVLEDGSRLSVHLVLVCCVDGRPEWVCRHYMYM